MSSFQPAAFPPAQPDDPNSPVLFKGNIDLVQTQISTVRSLAHEALNAIKGAYQPGSSPSHAAESIAALRQCLRTLNDILYTTGVGSLPLLPPEATKPFTEEQLADQANKAISTLFTSIQGCKRQQLSLRVSWRPQNRRLDAEVHKQLCE
ncbi:hypothetical protein BJV77DRAFT_1063092 [Russula vinacea]|nr:hypothetical protein BJV77DRAFT_1063092 [Russula vinacea]